MDFTIETLDWQTLGGGWERARLVVAKGDTAPDPSSTKRCLYGPGEVVYERFADGGIRATNYGCAVGYRLTTT